MASSRPKDFITANQLHRLATNSTLLHPPCFHWQAAEEGRRVELQELELSLKSLQAGLEGHKLQVGLGRQQAAATVCAVLGCLKSCVPHPCECNRLTSRLPFPCMQEVAAADKAAAARAALLHMMQVGAVLCMQAMCDCCTSSWWHALRSPTGSGI